MSATQKKPPTAERPPEKTAGEPAAARLPSSNVRGVLSLLIIVQLFLVLLVTSSNLAATRSPLQVRLLEVFGPYVQVFNFDVPYVRYYLTWGRELDLDHRIELLPEGGNAENPGDWAVLPPPNGFRGGESYHRWQRLAWLASYLAIERPEEGQYLSAVAVGVARQHRSFASAPPSRLRVRRHLLVEWGAYRANPAAPPDPWDESMFAQMADLNIILDPRSGRFSTSPVESQSITADSASE